MNRSPFFLLTLTTLVTSLTSLSQPAFANDFLATCRNTRLSNTKLSAECKDTQQIYHHTSIDLDGFVSNHDGDLVISVDEGNFAKTCKAIRLNRGNAVLSSKCRKINQQWKNTSLDLNQYIDNSDGRLILH
jgi:hypothetical protein